MVREFALANGAFRAVVCDHWASGGAGAVDLADAVIDACDTPNNFAYLYPLTLSIEEKIKIIATEMYGAGNIEYTDEVLQKIKMFTQKVSDYSFNKIAVSYLIMCKLNYIFTLAIKNTLLDDLLRPAAFRDCQIVSPFQDWNEDSYASVLKNKS